MDSDSDSGHEESDTTERLSLHFRLKDQVFYEGKRLSGIEVLAATLDARGQETSSCRLVSERREGHWRPCWWK